MTGNFRARAIRTSALTSALLLSAAGMTGAYAAEAVIDGSVSGAIAAGASGSEEVVVVAQKKAENVQKVPIAVTAIGTKELAARSITSFRDLQFNVPAVTYTKGNFGGNNFQIRGIGTNAVAASADTGVAVHTDDVYILSSVGLATSEYFDLDHIEVLRGPQSTLYGRNATGGAVNIITAKPQTDAFHANADYTYGTYNTSKLHAMINVPIIENQLAVRISGVYAHHDGYVHNDFTGQDDDSENQYSIRGAIRWTPSDSTTIDISAQENFEKDSHMRSEKQLCHRDPSGVLGCLPDALGFEPVNGNSTLGNIIISTTTLTPGFGLVDLGLGGPAIPGGGANASVPHDLFDIASDYDPSNRVHNQLYKFAIKQDITSWLTMNAVIGLQNGNYVNTEDYNQLVGDNVSAGITNAVNTLKLFGPAYAGYINDFFKQNADGTYSFATSNPLNNGLIGGNITGYSDRIQGQDRTDGTGNQATYELRFNTNFDGPVNFLLAGYYLKADSNARYFVNSSSLDYASVLLGALTAGPTADGTPQLLGPSNYLSDTALYSLKSKAVFGEVYWDVTDDLKITGGLRWLNDEKRTVAHTTLYNGVGAYPVTDLNSILGGFDAVPDVPGDPASIGNQLYADQHVSFNQVTGRIVASWSPQVDWADSTNFYASYSRGFKSGGINPPLSADLQGGVPQYFAPETIDAYEVGSKNRFFDNKLQVNLTAYYYTYKGYQVTDIIDRTSVNENIDSTIYGFEGEFVYKPDSHWQFNLNLTNTNSSIADGVSSIDQRNPGAGVANSVVIKDLGTAATCVILMQPGTTATPGDAGITGYAPPPGGSNQIASSGVPHVNYGNCSDGRIIPGSSNFDPALYAQYHYTTGADGKPSAGVAVDLGGNEMPQTPPFSFSVGAQYTFQLEDDLELVARVDYYWQTRNYARIYNDPVDKIDPWGVLNLSLQLNGPQDEYYVKVFCTNCTDEDSLTGEYLTDASSGLFTNAFVQDPRIVGVTVGVNF